MNFYNRSGDQIGQTFELDETLSNQTKAANAKATGEAVSDCYDKLDPEVWKDRIHYGLITEYGTYKGSINSSGEYVPGNSGVVSEFIPVVEGISYTIQKTLYMYSYNSSKEYITVSGSYPGNWTCPSGTAFVRLTATDANINLSRIVETEHFGEPNIDGYIYTGLTSASDELIRKGIESFAGRNSFCFEKSKNQFNYETDWIQYSGAGTGLNFSNGTFIYAAGDYPTNEFSTSAMVFPIKYFKVEEGQTLTANRRWQYGCYYNSNKEYLGQIQQQNSSYPSFVAPTGCAYARLAFNPMSSIEEVKGLTVYTLDFETENKRAPLIKNPDPIYRIDGNMISRNYLDKVVPSMQESEFLSAIKCLSIREANGREHSFRVGNLNTFVGNYARGWDLIKKMLMDFGVDFCGFQEVYQGSNGYDLASFLKSWQFPYGFYTNTKDGGDPIDKSFVSRYEVLSCTKLEFESASSNATYLNCKIQLPRLLDVYNPKRILSFYVVHLPVGNTTSKATIANELLSVIANDSSDYIVIAGDMNDMGTTEETKTYWRTLEAGGFRPVLPIESKTITDDENEVSTESDWRKMALDQFCISSNIEAVRYGIVNTKDGYGDSSVQTINGDPCLSDHDFVWTDLVFKDEERTTPN